MGVDAPAGGKDGDEWGYVGRYEGVSAFLPGLREYAAHGIRSVLNSVFLEVVRGDHGLERTRRIRRNRRDVKKN